MANCGLIGTPLPVCVLLHAYMYVRHSLLNSPQTPKFCYVRFRYLMVSGAGSRNQAHVLDVVGEETPGPNHACIPRYRYDIRMF